MRTYLSLLLMLLAMATYANQPHRKTKEPVDYVNNKIGNISHMLVPTFPTCHLPNSMLRMNPTHRESVTDRMDGFPLNCPSHRQGDVLYLMPYCGDKAGVSTGYQYLYDQEITTPYRYYTILDDYEIEVEFAPAAKAAIYSFTYNQSGDRYMMLKTLSKGEIKITQSGLSGYDDYKGTKHYFFLEFDQKPIESGVLASGKQEVVFVKFAPNVKTVNARYGISYIDAAQAEKNLRKEISGFSIETLAQNARGVWNKTLGKIEVTGGTEDQKVAFYTALYRSHERMINITEDGRYYSAYDGKVHNAEGVDFWIDDWIWDTYLALHPLQILLNTKEQEQKIHSYIRMCEQSGWMPTFPCVFGDAHCMNGNHAASMFADALCKGIPFDVAKAFEGMKHTVMTESMIPWYRGAKTELDDFYHANGWFPALHPGEEEWVKGVSSFEKREAVAVTLAASYDDWCIAQLAKKLGKEADYTFFYDRSYNYRKLFNKETGFFHPKDKDGKFIEPFDYNLSGGVGARDYYDENNAWTYIWDVHHNIGDLINLFGSNERFIKQLDRLFVEGIGMSKWQYAGAMPDATGMVGQFVMGNEPSFHIPYLYNYVGQPWKTQKRVRMLLESWFRNDLMGVPGDEDGGGMMAFVVFSSMGFYPVSPGIPAYNIGSPLFEKSAIALENGKTFTVLAPKASKENKYIQSAKLNGKPFNKTYFTHDDILNGGTLELELGPRPNKSWGVGADAIPPSQATMKP